MWRTVWFPHLLRFALSRSLREIPWIGCSLAVSLLLQCQKHQTKEQPWRRDAVAVNHPGLWSSHVHFWQQFLFPLFPYAVIFCLPRWKNLSNEAARARRDDLRVSRYRHLTFLQPFILSKSLFLQANWRRYWYIWLYNINEINTCNKTSLAEWYFRISKTDNHSK